MSEASITTHWWKVLRRRWPIGAGVFAGVMLLSAAILFLAKPIWRADATMRLGAASPSGNLALGGGAPTGLFAMFQQMSGDPFANELELLSSRTVIEGVVEDNALNVGVRAPRGWTRDSFFVALQADRNTAEAEFELSWASNGVTVRRISPTSAALGTYAFGLPAHFGGVTATFQPMRADAPKTIRLRTMPFGAAVRNTKARLHADKIRREANLVRLKYEDADPALAQNVLTSATQRYVALRAQLQHKESGQTVDSLRAVANQTMAELRRQETGMESFQQQSRVVAPEFQSEAFVKRQADVIARLESTRLELARADEIVRQLDSIQDPALAWAGLVADPAFARNVTMGTLLTNLVNLQQQRIALAGRRTSEDAQVQNIEHQITYLDSSLRKLVREYRDGLASSVRLLSGQASALDSQLRQVPAGAIEYGRRQRELKLLSEVYLFTDQRARQEDLRNAISFANIQVVDPPATSYKPVWPRKKLGLLVGFIIGLTFATFGMALAERVDGSIRETASARALFGAPIVATLSRNGTGTVALDAAQRQALRLGMNGQRMLVVAPATTRDTDAASAVTDALTQNARVPVHAGVSESEIASIASLAIEQAAAPETFATAAQISEYAAAGAGVVLVVDVGVTQQAAVKRAAHQLREAGVAASGIVLVGTPHQIRDLW